MTMEQAMQYHFDASNHALRQEYIEGKGEEIIKTLDSMTPLDREDIMAVVFAKYCKYCWRERPDHGSCKCTNDE